MFGGAGLDTFQLGFGSGTDVIDDFDVTEDILQFSGAFTAGLTLGLTDLVTEYLTIEDMGADTKISFNQSDSVVLFGVNAADLTDVNFLFT